MSPNESKRRPPLWAGLLAVAGVLMAASSVHAGLADCGASIVRLDRTGSTPSFSVDAFAYDSTFIVSGLNAHVTFDRTTAELSLGASSGGRANVAVRVVETFDVVGVAPGTAVAATIEMRLDGWSEQYCGGSGCGVLLEGRLAVGSDSLDADASQFGPGNGRRDIHTVLTLPVTLVAGAPVEARFLLVFGTGPGGGALADAVASYSLSGLPAGVRAIACSGADVTPARPVPWGSLKARYRR